MPPRQIRPKNEPSTTDDGAGDLRGGKRKAVSSACIPCRKRKSKCDGNLPSCSTCIAVYRTECSYDADSDHRRKGALKRDLQSLQQQNDSMDVIIASLRSLPEEDAVTLLHGLRGDADPDALAESLRANVRLPHSFAPQTLEADFAREIGTPSTAPFNNSPFHASNLSREGSGDSGLSLCSATAPTPLIERPTSWFDSQQDAEFVDHLLRLYSCWVEPFHGVLCWDLFTNDFSRGKTDFCSSLLVNAILSLACHYSDRPAARTDPSNPATAGDRFFAEAIRLLNQVDRPSLTTVQALGIMGMREGSAGRDSSSYQLIGRCVRMALEMGLHLSSLRQGLSDVEIEARKNTFWAVFRLETVCAVHLGRLSQLPRLAADVETPSLRVQTESPTWRPYVESNLATNASAEQPSRAHLFKRQVSLLSELAGEMVNTFYAPREIFTSRKLAAMYQQFQTWYRDLPEAFHLANTTLPHVIVLHMYYYTCILHLFRPYIKLDLRVANLFPRDTCTSCANEISALVGALRAMYGLRRVVSPTASSLLSACTIHLLNLPSEGAASNLCQGMLDLEAMSVNHGMAARAVEIIRSLSNKWKIPLPEAAAVVANYRMANRAGSGNSPPQSSFFAATIWRKQSSESKKSSQSAQSRSSYAKDSPFSPPPPFQVSQNSKSAQFGEPVFCDDPAAPLDPTHAHYWTPFPSQIMPLVHSHEVDMLGMDAQFDEQQQWHAMSQMHHDAAFSPPHSGTDGQSLHLRDTAQQIDEAASEQSTWKWQ